MRRGTPSGVSGFMLFKNEPYLQAGRRIFTEQCNLISQYSQSAAGDPDKAVHEIRKATKRIRTLLLVFRYYVGEAHYIAEKQCFANLSRWVAPHRVSWVNHFLVCELRNRVAYLPFANQLETIRQALAERILRSALDMKQNQVFERIRSNAKERRFDPPEAGNVTDLLRSMITSVSANYRKAQAAYQRASGNPEPEIVHAYRKQVKKLWYMMTLMRKTWPAMMDLHVRILNRMGEKLGTEHDLAELIDYLSSGQDGLVASDYQLLVRRIEKYRKDTRRSIWFLSARYFAESPGAFKKKLEIYSHQFFGS